MAFFQKLKKSILEEVKTPIKSKEGQLKKIKEVKKWFESEGKLTVDLFKTEGNLVIQSTIAGVKPEDLEITIQGDIVAIKGTRAKPENGKEKSYYYQECYWGPFSRQIVLPEEVDPSRTEATLQEGILTIKLPCIEREKKRTIVIRG